MYDDLERSQRPSHLEWLVVNMVLPTLVVSFALQWRAERPAWPRGPETEPVICILNVMGVDERPWASGPIPDFFPELLSMPRPKYAAATGQPHGEPRVFLRALVEPSGRIAPSSIVVVQSPDSELNAPARHALAAAVFRPARLAGHRIAAWITIAVTFTIPRE